MFELEYISYLVSATPLCTAGCRLVVWEAAHIFWSLRRRRWSRETCLWVDAFYTVCWHWTNNGRPAQFQLTCRYRAFSGVVVDSVHMLPALGTEVERTWRGKRSRLWEHVRLYKAIIHFLVCLTASAILSPSHNALGCAMPLWLSQTPDSQAPVTQRCAMRPHLLYVLWISPSFWDLWGTRLWGERGKECHVWELHRRLHFWQRRRPSTPPRAGLFL